MCSRSTGGIRSNAGSVILPATSFFERFVRHRRLNQRMLAEARLEKARLPPARSRIVRCQRRSRSSVVANWMNTERRATQHKRQDNAAARPSPRGVPGNPLLTTAWRILRFGMPDCAWIESIPASGSALAQMLPLPAQRVPRHPSHRHPHRGFSNVRTSHPMPNPTSSNLPFPQVATIWSAITSGSLNERAAPTIGFTRPILSVYSR